MRLKNERMLLFILVLVIPKFLIMTAEYMFSWIFVLFEFIVVMLLIKSFLCPGVEE
jgi:hypothetical protein